MYKDYIKYTFKIQLLKELYNHKLTIQLQTQFIMCTNYFEKFL